MIINEIGEIIAERRFSSDAQTGEITVLIGKPSQFPDSTDYFTPFQIIGIGSEKIKYGAGVDGVQALQLTIKMVGYELKALNESLDQKLYWEGDENGALGFES